MNAIESYFEIKPGLYDDIYMDISFMEGLNAKVILPFF